MCWVIILHAVCIQRYHDCLCIAVPPRIVDFDGNVTVDIGHSAELKCMGLGNPRPQIAWMFEGRPVNLADARFTLMNNGTLRIDGVMEDDLGYYTCIVQNSAGDTNLSLLLDIKCNILLDHPRFCPSVRPSVLPLPNSCVF